MLAQLDGLDEEEYKWALIFLFETQFVYFLTFPREYYEYYYSYKPFNKVIPKRSGWKTC